MEAVLAVALAGNILQFLQATCSILSKTKQLYSSIDGSLVEHADSKWIAQDIEERSKQIGQAVGEILDLALCKVWNECANMTSELLKVPEKLQVKGMSLSVSESTQSG